MHHQIRVEIEKNSPFWAIFARFGGNLVEISRFRDISAACVSSKNIYFA